MNGSEEKKRPTKNPDGNRGSSVGRVVGDQAGVYTRLCGVRHPGAPPLLSIRHTQGEFNE